MILAIRGITNIKLTLLDSILQADGHSFLNLENILIDNYNCMQWHINKCIGYTNDDTTKPTLVTQLFSFVDKNKLNMEVFLNNKIVIKTITEEFYNEKYK